MGIAIVTGAYRGLGLGVSEDLASKGHTVIMTARKAAALDQAYKKLKSKGLDVHPLELDVSNAKSVQTACAKVLSEFKKVDLLINNAGIFSNGLEKDIFGLSEALSETLATNTVGPALMIQAVLPSMKKNNFGRIVNVSSGMGGLTEMEGGYLAYRTSKTALNVVTRVFAKECEGKDILINSVCPGWVKTDMGGANATRELGEGVASIVWAAYLPKGGPSGGFFRDGKPLAW